MSTDPMQRLKRFIAVLLLAVVIDRVPTAIAAEQTKTRPVKPPTAAQLHYTQRVQSFREQNQRLDKGKPDNVVLVGDSITEGFDVAKFFSGRPVLNRGIGSDVIGNALAPGDNRGVLKRLDESFFDCAAQQAFLLIGINDLGDGHSPATIEAGYREILERIKKHSPELRVHVQSVLPARGKFAKFNTNVLDVNQRLQKLAAEFGYDYFDLHTLMKDNKGELKAELTSDGLHLNPAGYKIWQAAVNKALGW
jgi:lysophospholipase L1-like esterase